MSKLITPISRGYKDVGGESVQAKEVQLDLNLTVSKLPILAFQDRVPRPVEVARAALYRRYAPQLTLNPDLTRRLVSFQANKQAPFYRWFKFKEAFSLDFVRYCLDCFRPQSSFDTPCILDPFAGSGTTLTTAAKAGWYAVGIELLPVAAAIIRARLLTEKVKVRSFEYHLKRLETFPIYSSLSSTTSFPHLKITQNAFPKRTEQALSSFTVFLESIQDPDTHFLFWFACLCVLEDVSYTRKDGQYLRWDYRSGKCLKANFHKGTVQEFQSAILSKLRCMLEDIKRRDGESLLGKVNLVEGSCLSELPQLPEESFHLVVTSPPYCNRYDYTRTYALELAYMNYNERAVKDLRQALLSCTVENKSKREQLKEAYRSRGRESNYREALTAFENQEALQEVLMLLYKAREKGELNNNNLPILVENYFFEMNLVIRELARLLAPGGGVVMVNDNVQYMGEEIPVDLVLSDFAAHAGLRVDHIWVLPRGKGNSSQQMGNFGRNELRKCVYVWSKP